MTKDSMAIAFNRVRYCYGEVCAIQHATFELKKNSLTALIGPNGGGKSPSLNFWLG